MSRLYQNQEFLDNIVNFTARQRVKEIKKASEEEIKTLFEIFLNSSSLPLSKSEEKTFKKHLKVLKQFGRKRWTVKLLRTFFITNSKTCAEITSLVLNKVLEGSVCGFLNNGG